MTSFMYKLLNKNPYNAGTTIVSAFKLSTAAHSPLLHFPATQEPEEQYSYVSRSLHFRYYEFIDERLRYLLHSCKGSPTLDSIQSFHALNVTMGAFARQPIYFTNNVISIYASLGFVSVARKVFDGMPLRNAVSYNTLINAYGRAGLAKEAWGLFSDLRVCGFIPTEFTFVGVLSCDGLDLRNGQVLHSLIIQNGMFSRESYVGTALIGLLGNHGLVYEAEKVFEDMHVKSLVSWNSLISVLGSHGYMEDSVSLFQDLMKMGFGVSHSTLVGLLSSIGGAEALSLAEQLHCLIIKSGLACEILVLNSLLHMYVKCCGIRIAEKLLRTFPFCDVVSYNTVISALARTDRPERALELLLELSRNGLLASEVTYVGLVNCCKRLEEPKSGAYVHTKVIKSAMETNVQIGSALVDFYGKCHLLNDSYHCFDEIRDKNTVSWNALIQSYSKENHGASLSLLKEMLWSGLYPNEFTFSALFKSMLVLELKELHCLTLKLGHHDNEYVLSSLITTYAQNRLIADALVLARSFETRGSTVSSNVIAALYNRDGQYDKTLEMLSVVDEPDLVSWNILISTCSHNGYYSEVFELFKLMQLGNNDPDEYTMVSILCVCTNLCSLALGTSVHGLMIKANLDHGDTFVRNILIDMYGKCGSVAASVKLFRETSEKNLVTWTTLISALGYHGYAGEALERLKDMEVQGLKPDSVMFVSLLSACRHGGLVKEGLDLFMQMENVYGIKPEMVHYQGIVDLLSRYGHLKEAEQVISRMPFRPNALIWRSFLEGCKRHKSTKFQSCNMVDA